MRILHITVRADRGGGPENIYRLAVLSTAGVENHVACPREDPYWERYQRLLGRQRLCEIPHRRFSLAAVARLVRYCRHHRIELIHSHGFGAGLYSRLLSLLVTARVVHTFHGFHLHREQGLGPKIKLLTEKAVRTLTTHYLAVSWTEAAAVSRALQLPPSRLTVISNGVDTERFAPAPSMQPPGEFVILAALRLSDEKNPLDLVRILARLKALFPESRARLRIAGDGPLRPAMEAEVARLGLGECVQLPGWCDHMETLYAGAHVYLTASRGEGLSLGMLEAFASGLPVVATSVQGHTDVVCPGMTGFLFFEGDLDAAAEHLYRLETDAGLYERLSAAVRQTVVAEFGLAASAARHEELFQRLVERHGAGSTAEAEVSG
mgnify:CR=1 FL=1